jgi:sialate O-acetylesterase
MYNAMIAPITNLSIKGVIWYQGETNVIQKNGLAYTDKMKDLIDGWRGAFRNPSMPFYYVQLAPWGNPRYADGQLPALWEAQAATL